MLKLNKLLVLFVPLCFVPLSVAEGIEVNIESDVNQIDSNQDLVLNIRFTNTENVPLDLLSWYLPGDDTSESLFKIKKDGVQHRYFGAHAKRPAPVDNDYITFAPQETREYTMELTGLYDLSQTGNYNIQYQVRYLELVKTANNNVESQQISSNELDIWVEGRGDSYQDIQKRYQNTQRLAPQQPGLAPGLGQGFGPAASPPLAYTGNCSNSEKSILQNAFNSAKTIANNSVSYLNNETGNRFNPRYSTWFGSYNSGNWGVAKTNFTNIKRALDNQTITFDCLCNYNYYAFVYPDQPYKIYICNNFWRAPNTGTDSRSGTIIHEMSHFTVIADTDDLAYGHTAAKNLANSNPANALKNADSHEYFAENTPYQR